MTAMLEEVIQFGTGIQAKHSAARLPEKPAPRRKQYKTEKSKSNRQ